MGLEWEGLRPIFPACPFVALMTMHGRRGVLASVPSLSSLHATGCLVCLSSALRTYLHIPYTCGRVEDRVIVSEKTPSFGQRHICMATF
jgi:hypothetical protein